MKAKLFITAVLMSVSLMSVAQVRVGLGLGYAMPNGDLKDLADGGVGFAANIRYAILDKLEVGVEYDGNILVSVDDPTADDTDIGAYFVSGIMGKVQYNFLDSKVTPYVAMGLGVFTNKVPEITVTVLGQTEVVQPEEKSSGFGFAPEVGFNLGGFNLGAKYVMAGAMPGIYSGVDANFIKLFFGYNIKFG